MAAAAAVVESESDVISTAEVAGVLLLLLLLLLASSVGKTFIRNVALPFIVAASEAEAEAEATVRTAPEDIRDENAAAAGIADRERRSRVAMVEVDARILILNLINFFFWGRAMIYRGELCGGVDGGWD